MVTVRELYRNKEAYSGKEVTIGGWVRNNRDSKNFGFLVISDGTFFETIQVVYGDKVNNFDEIAKLNIGAAVVVTGEFVLTPGAKQPFEIQATNVEVEGQSTPDYLFRIKDIHWNIFVQFHIFVREQIHFRQYLECVH